MTKREQLLNELKQAPDAVIDAVLTFLQQHHPQQTASTPLLDFVDQLNAQESDATSPPPPRLCQKLGSLLIWQAERATMRTVFANTGYWIALINPDDDLHPKARQLTLNLSSGLILTSEMVFTELLNAFSSKGNLYRHKAVALIHHALSTPSTRIVPQTDILFKAALELYSQRPDQAWSHTDCSSFYIMRQQAILEALAYDKHFEQAGFIPLLSL